MQDIVDEVLKVEAGAEKIITEAKEKAKDFGEQAEHRVSERINEARLEAQNIVRAGVAKAKEMAASEYKKAMEQAETRSEEFLKENQKKLDFIVDKIVDFIITPEFERD